MESDNLREGCRILVVEDDPASREILGRILVRLGHEVCLVDSVDNALKRLDGHTHCILDLMLADGSGVEVLKEIRKSGRRIRVALATAVTESLLCEEARELHPEIVFRKPLDLTQIVEWLGKPRPNSDRLA